MKHVSKHTTYTNGRSKGTMQFFRLLVLEKKCFVNDDRKENICAFVLAILNVDPLIVHSFVRSHFAIDCQMRRLHGSVCLFSVNAECDVTSS